MLRSADEIVLLDSVQYTKRDWRNRNRIKTAKGALWLTIPVEVKGRYFQAIEGIEVTWMDYRGYPDYPQPWGDFEPRVSIVDLMMNTGADAPRYLDRTLT
jgi:hypothetical protein